MSSTLTTLYEDAQLLVVDKPTGMLVHRGWGDDDVALVDLVRARTAGRAAHPVQRLDRGASGAVVFARDSESARLLSVAQANGELDKRYLALVRGQPPDAATIDHAIPNKPDGPRVDSVTVVRRVATVACEPRAVSLVEVAPLTGRLHQIRRHLKHLGHPLLGDANYGRGDLNREVARRYGLTRLALHAHAFSLVNPVTGARVEGVAAVPDDLTSPMREMGLLA
ncbi:MAG: pseudouridylate synthase [Polyangiaceae bacterium]|nr:pseudouridylate synthase [Polyangiaceae bacterium]